MLRVCQPDVTPPRRLVYVLFGMICLVFAGQTPSAAPSIALLQHMNRDAGVTTAATVAFGANTGAGNWIAVTIRAGASGGAFTVSDTQGNSYHQAVRLDVTVDTPKGDTLAIFYAENIKGGANAITVTSSISGGTLRVAI